MPAHQIPLDIQPEAQGSRGLTGLHSTVLIIDQRALVDAAQCIRCDRVERHDQAEPLFERIGMKKVAPLTEGECEESIIHRNDKYSGRGLDYTQETTSHVSLE